MSNLIGKTLLNRYNVHEFLGRGGMAEVYKVWDNQRAVHLALKLLREDLAEDKVFLRRFKREAQTLAKLQHPNIVRFYGLEQVGSLAFMLMDFVEGMPLRREIFSTKAPLEYRRILEVFRATCSALHYAHNNTMVHCDIKPGNILTDRSGRVFVTDFGIARMSDAATATMVGTGTPAYMAPEQVRGEDPTPQIDIYGLGVVLYEMLTGGERPFTGEHATITGSTSEKVRWEQINLKPPSPRKWNSDIPKELEAVVLKCLSKDQGDRYSDALSVLNALEMALKDLVDEQAPARLPALPNIPENTISDTNSQLPNSNTWMGNLFGTKYATWLILAGIGGILSLSTLFGWLAGGGTLSAPPPTDTQIVTILSTNSPTVTSTNTLTFTPSNTPTITLSPTITLTPTMTFTPTWTATLTRIPTITYTPKPKILTINVTNNNCFREFLYVDGKAINSGIEAWGGQASFRVKEGTHILKECIADFQNRCWNEYERTWTSDQDITLGRLSNCPTSSTSLITIEFKNLDCRATNIYIDGRLETTVSAHGSSSVRVNQGYRNIKACETEYNTCGLSTNLYYGADTIHTIFNGCNY